MAKQTGLIKFTGRLDNVIGYYRNGVHYVRSMPENVRQTAGTKQAARNFGIISRKGKLIRKALIPYLNMRYDGTIVNRLNKKLVEAGANSLQKLEGLRFNRHTGIEKMFLAQPVLTDNGTLHIPAQELLPQGAATHLEVQLIAARINFAEKRIVDTGSSTAIIDLREPFNGTELSIDLPGNGTLFIVLQCKACTACNGRLYASGDRRYAAADLLRVIAPAAPVQKVIRKKGTQKRPVYRRQAARMARRNSNTPPSVFMYQLE